MFKKINLKRLSKEATWIIIGQAGTAIAGLFGVKLLTNVLTPEEFGKVALANTIAALVSTNFLFGPLGQGILRFWAISKDRDNLSEFYAVSNQLKRNAIAISILAGALLVVTVFFMRGIEWSALLAVSCAVGIFGGWLGLRASVFTAARKRQLVAFLNTGSAFLRPVFAVCFILLLSSSAFWAMAGYLLAAILMVLLAEWFYQQKITGSAVSKTNLSSKITTGIKKEILSFSWPFAVWGIFGWVHLSCDKWALQTFYGPEIVGPFAVVTLLAAYPLIFGSGFLSTLIVPVAYERAGDLTQQKKLMSAYHLIVYVIAAYIMGLVTLIWLYFRFHHNLVLLISNKQFAEVSYLLPWLTGAWGLFYLGQVLSSIGMIVNKSRIYIAPKIVAAVIAGASTFYLASKYGTTGVAWGLGLAGFVYSVWCLGIAVKIIQCPITTK